MFALFEDLEGIPARWLLVGAAAVYGLGKIGRPLAKGAIKGYLATRDRLSQVTGEAREGLHDLYEEAAGEYQQSLQTSQLQPRRGRRASRAREDESGARVAAPAAEAA